MGSKSRCAHDSLVCFSKYICVRVTYYVMVQCVQCFVNNSLLSAEVTFSECARL